MPGSGRTPTVFRGYPGTEVAKIHKKDIRNLEFIYYFVKKPSITFAMLFPENREQSRRERQQQGLEVFV